MFIGHIGVAMGAKVAAPRISLGTLVIAAQFVDLLWPVLVLAGIEHARVVPGIMAALFPQKRGKFKPCPRAGIPGQDGSMS